MIITEYLIKDNGETTDKGLIEYKCKEEIGKLLKEEIELYKTRIKILENYIKEEDKKCKLNNIKKTNNIAEKNLVEMMSIRQKISSGKIKIDITNHYDNLNNKKFYYVAISI